MRRELLFLYSVLVTAALLIVLFQHSEREFQYSKDARVVFAKEVVDTLNARYSSEGPEELYCLMGSVQGDTIHVDSLSIEKLVYQDFKMVVYENDPPCQYPSSVGSLHTHPSSYGCGPSNDDYFTFGEMKDPEPVINAIQCGIDSFFIFRMPGKQEPFDFRLLRWSISQP